MKSELDLRWNHYRPEMTSSQMIWFGHNWINLQNFKCHKSADNDLIGPKWMKIFTICIKLYYSKSTDKNGWNVLAKKSMLVKTNLNVCWWSMLEKNFLYVGEKNCTLAKILNINLNVCWWSMLVKSMFLKKI